MGISSLLLEVAQRAVRKELINSYQLSRSVILICDLLLSTALRRCTDHKSNGPKRYEALRNTPVQAKQQSDDFLLGCEHAIS